MEPRLEGRHALVTGAGSGIGRAIAIELARRGASLALVGRDPSKLDSVRAEIEAAGGAAAAHPCDVGSSPAREALVVDLSGRHDRLDVLVHAAGIYLSGSIEDVSPEALESLIRVNTTGPLALTRALLALLRAARGDVVFVNSSVVQRPAPGVAHYAATKQALRALADALRDEINPDGVRVLSVYAGRTATPMQASIFEAEGRPYPAERLLQPEDVARMVAETIALPRTAEVTELSIRPATRT